MQQLNLLLVSCALLVLLSWLAPHRFQIPVISIGTAVFLAYFAPKSFVILSISTTLTFGVFKLKIKTKWAALLAICLSLCYLVFYKIGMGRETLSSLDRLVPLGLSYYAFRQIHYALEMYKDKLPQHTFFDYINYLFFLPTILIGPIHRFEPFMRNAYRRRWDSMLFSEGLERVLYGYVKIVIINNYLISVLLFQQISNIGSSSIWLGTYLRVFSYTLETYILFSGFSDVAVGLALMMGFRVMENFNYPFFAPNINEFWNRWHISLTSWCKDYIFIPISSFTRKPILGIISTMLVIGLWHEISWRYLVWGAFHGLGIACWHIYNRTAMAKALTKRSSVLRIGSIIITFHFVMVSFVLIREVDMANVINTLKILFTTNY
ncbi:MAG: hypothetical protein KJP00_06200 [Bacteroidia bacterium]|nr:hypothetical protein [Bacteroidia bacterium]